MSRQDLCKSLLLVLAPSTSAAPARKVLRYSSGAKAPLHSRNKRLQPVLDGTIKGRLEELEDAILPGNAHEGKLFLQRVRREMTKDFSYAVTRGPAPCSQPIGAQWLPLWACRSSRRCR